MAKTPLNQNVSASSSYTIPAGKYAIFTATLVGNIGGLGTANPCQLVIGSAMSAYFPAVGAEAKPRTANAGDVLSVNQSVEGPHPVVGISGFLYDL